MLFSGDDCNINTEIFSGFRHYLHQSYAPAHEITVGSNLDS